MVPEHLQGENKGLSSWYSSERQILQSGAVPEAIDSSLKTKEEGTYFV